MPESEDRANYAFLVQVSSTDYNLLNSFGYKTEGKFQDKITRRIMTALADYPHIVAINIVPVENLINSFGAVEKEEEEEEAGDE